MTNPGKLTVVLIVGAAVAVAAGTVWYQHQVSRRVLELWGAETALLITRAPQVELLRLAPSAAGTSTAVAPWPLPIDGDWDATESPGINNVRHALVQDSTYTWTPPADLPTWDYALRFVEGEREAVVLLSLGQCCVALASQQRIVGLHPTACSEVGKFAREVSEPIP